MKTDYIYIILIFIFIVLLIFTIIYFVKNANLIKSDPLIYGMKKHNFTSCSCFDSKGNNYQSYGEGFIFVDNSLKFGGLK
jgi:hypothetical protein